MVFEKWQAVEYENRVWVFRNGALLDSGTDKFAIYGSLALGEALAALLNSNR